jgi:hypothetical protein
LREGPERGRGAPDSVTCFVKSRLDFQLDIQRPFRIQRLRSSSGKMGPSRSARSLPTRVPRRPPPQSSPLARAAPALLRRAGHEKPEQHEAAPAAVLAVLRAISH